ncbi:hypothetical protein [Streptomyces sp. NPDC058653]|uniref:hypothetical protein n=1 Tax=Streptomyces sp. NPDC058653 TaxID=3346576 RepID=UPI003659ABD5
MACTRLGRLAPGRSPQAMLVACVRSFVGAALPLVLGVLLPVHPWMVIALAIVALAIVAPAIPGAPAPHSRRPLPRLLAPFQDRLGVELDSARSSTCLSAKPSQPPAVTCVNRTSPRSP